MANLPLHDPSIQWYSVFIRAILWVRRVFGNDFSRQNFNINAAVAKYREAVMAFNYRPVWSGLERARTARSQRIQEFIRRQLAELSELYLAQRTIGMKRLQRWIKS